MTSALCSLSFWSASLGLFGHLKFSLEGVWVPRSASMRIISDVFTLEGVLGGDIETVDASLRELDVEGDLRRPGVAGDL